IRFDEPMSEHTSLKIGGPAEIMLFPEDPLSLKKIILGAGEADDQHTDDDESCQGHVGVRNGHHVSLSLNARSCAIAARLIAGGPQDSRRRTRVTKIRSGVKEGLLAAVSLA
ncbi:MAG: hypothetical protein GY820_33410, partial [Gammaproteobacteria bacterium]|nr:hypothetical protein [Gammaproteobacteria bacterium]